LAIAGTSTVIACKGESTQSAGDAGACEPGTERCACYGNGTCNDDLQCLSDFCVDVSDDDDESSAGRGPKGKTDSDGGAQTADDGSDDSQSSDGGKSSSTAQRPDSDEEATRASDSDAGGDSDGANSGAGDTADAPDDGAPTPDETSTDETSTDDADSSDSGEQSSDDSTTVEDDASADDVTSTDDVASADDGVPNGEQADASVPSNPQVDAGAPMIPEIDPDPPAPGELITNGDFSQGTLDWNIELPDAEIDTSSGALCVSADFSEGTLGWPLDSSIAFAVEEDASYEFSFDGWYITSSGYVLFEAKIGEAVSPYSSMLTWYATIGGEPKNLSTQIVPIRDYPQTGVAFNITLVEATICIDNVSVRRVD
jgi:hypothetical protein